MTKIKPTDLPNIFTIAGGDVTPPLKEGEGLPALSNIDDRPCESCEMSRVAHEELPENPLCPYCGAELSPGMSDVITLLETNGSEKQEAFKAITERCPNCREFVALVPTAVIWNANHDVYYTGGHDYLPDREHGDELRKVVLETIKPTIKQFVDRIKLGESQLTEENLTYWLSGNIESICADFITAARKRGRSGMIRRRKGKDSGLENKPKQLPGK